jgi:DNA-binding winged helix-turn-helix (wHTH) protein
MDAGCFRFEEFVLDPSDRQLTRDGQPVEISGRYLDALILLVRESGRLVGKDRFHDEVWRGIPVTDEALTQCIRSLRRELGDDASKPRLIETVPKHGYRFIAPVVEQRRAAPARAGQNGPAIAFTHAPALAAAGTVGGGLAGLVGGLFYGFIGAADGAHGGTGSMSALLVILCLCILVAVIAGAGVSTGIAAAGLDQRSSPLRLIAGGAVGGLLIGALAQLLGLDAFTLLVGHAPVGITGAPEGALIGAAVGLGASFAIRGAQPSRRRAGLIGAACGLAAGALVSSLGGRLMVGSLDLLARTFPDSRLRLGHLGALFGEDGVGPITRLVSASLEGMLFCAFVVAALVTARRQMDDR